MDSGGWQMGNEDPFHPSAVGYGVAELMPCSETRRLKSNHPENSRASNRIYRRYNPDRWKFITKSWSLNDATKTWPFGIYWIYGAQSGSCMHSMLELINAWAGLVSHSFELTSWVLTVELKAQDINWWRIGNINWCSNCLEQEVPILTPLKHGILHHHHKHIPALLKKKKKKHSFIEKLKY